MLSLSLDLRQKQSLVMTPQLMQAIRLLQMSNLELVSAIAEELDRNPLLEAAEGGDSAFDTAGGAAEGGPAAADGGDARAPADEADGFADGDGAAPSDHPTADEPLDPFERISERPSGPAPAGTDGLADIEAIAATAAKPRTLHDHVEEQLAHAGFDPVERAIASFLSGCLEATGYLPVTTGEAAAALGVPQARVEAVLARLQGLDPPGIFARDLAECLALQLAARGRLDPAIAAVLDNLPLLARRDFPRLKRLCGLDDEDIADIVREIRGLDPKPGLAFDLAPVRAIVPDVFVKRRADGEWAVELNTRTLPRVLVDRRYYAVASQKLRTAEDKAFLGACLQSANWLVKSLEQRAQTILKVAAAIVAHQRDFFEHGVTGLKPLTLRAVADRIDMHESTVSRVTANKYLACPRGLFELKYFFPVGIASSDGADAVSAAAVRHRIRALIDAEPANAVYSDDAIVRTLRAAGVDIARRTVAKYRESMSIPSSVQRRREKARMSLDA